VKIPGILLALSCFRSVYANAPTIEMGEDVHIAPRCAAVVLAGGTAMGLVLHMLLLLLHSVLSASARLVSQVGPWRRDGSRVFH